MVVADTCHVPTTVTLQKKVLSLFSVQPLSFKFDFFFFSTLMKEKVFLCPDSPIQFGTNNSQTHLASDSFVCKPLNASSENPGSRSF